MDYQLLFSRFAAQPAHTRWSRQRQLHECLRHAIRSGTLSAGARLPATRALALELGVSRNTVLYAYDQLSTEGFVQPGQRGTVVAGLTARVAPTTGPGHAPCVRACRAARSPTAHREAETAEGTQG